MLQAASANKSQEKQWQAGFTKKQPVNAIAQLHHLCLMQALIIMFIYMNYMWLLDIIIPYISNYC